MSVGRFGAVPSIHPCGKIDTPTYFIDNDYYLMLSGAANLFNLNSSKSDLKIKTGFSPFLLNTRFAGE